jgi:ribosome-binding protein aMBF1 (putative translation factor)
MAKTLKTFKAELLSKKSVRDRYEELVPEYAIARAIIKARRDCGMTQAQLARRMKTSQSYIARLESGTSLPAMKTLLRVAQATGTAVNFSLDPTRPVRRAA